MDKDWSKKQLTYRGYIILDWWEYPYILRFGKSLKYAVCRHLKFWLSGASVGEGACVSCCSKSPYRKRIFKWSGN